MLPDVNYGNSLDDSYCTEMQKAALLLYAIYAFQKCTHYCMWDIDWKRLDRIHSYTSENWFIILFISESQDSPPQFMAKLQKV